MPRDVDPVYWRLGIVHLVVKPAAVVNASETIRPSHATHTKHPTISALAYPLPSAVDFSHFMREVFESFFHRSVGTVGIGLACDASSQIAWTFQRTVFSTTIPGIQRIKTRWNTQSFRNFSVTSVAAGSSNTRWKARQGKDQYAREAKVRGLKSRAAFKLLEMDAKYHLFKPGQMVVDLVSYSLLCSVVWTLPQ